MLNAEIDWTLYVEQTVQLMGLTVSDADRRSVVHQMERLAAIAPQVMEFVLPDDLEVVSTFEP
ncbi:DUF4089 domain-containing protein [Spirulina major CS-329]|uniref:DUF4089 domain-containing protein n=1 Tax=Spirulina TaxID=1154 RepID=UPI00232DEC58|nr:MULTISPECIES: DUF4089 domain-containing protein [Spirulina]MDB9493307.1 DUF4089 domain-containing protein [Spirulina subsalsa CS-330]MDB9504499.1 DUF4089 domain-containing protein [Spirulina major CS-329]